MPNLNFTSSSFAQQDRYAQTTVSYESRNMQSIPFYPGVDHKAKLRGIMAMSLVIAIVVGAILGTLYGLRDYILDWAKSTPIYTAVTGDDNETPPPADEEMNVSLAALGYTDIVVINDGKPTKDVDYNGMEHTVTWGVSKDVEDPGNVEVNFTWQMIKNSNGTSCTDTPKPVATNGWPKNAGTYLVKAFISGDKIADSEKHVTLTISKATIAYPGLVLPDATERVYDGTAKSVSLENELPADYTGGYSITYKLNGSNVKEIKNAGTYSVSLTVKGDSNYANKTYTGTTLTIDKAKVLASAFDEAFADNLNAVYTGTAQSIEIDTELLPADFPADFKAEIEEGSIVSYSKTVANPTNVGTYSIKALFNSKNYTVVGEVSATLVITPADLTKYFTFPAVNTVYNGKAVGKEYLEITKKPGFPDVISENISIAYTYYDAKDKEISPANIKDAGSYTAVVKFATGANYITPEDITIKVTVAKAKIDLTKITITPPSPFTYSGRTYSINNSNITGIPEGVTADFTEAGAVNAGTHTVTVKFKGGTNYENAEMDTQIVIQKAQFSYVNITAKAIQYVTKDGTVHLPAWTGELPEGAWVDYYVGGKQIEGIDRLGTYDVDIVVTDENHVFSVPVKFIVQFNWLTILFGALLGIVVALIIAPLVWLGYRRIESQSFKKFARLRARILHERGGARGAIVCEGRVTIINLNSEQEIRDFPWFIEPRWGRLYLTHATLEYYDGDYKKNYRNQLIQLKDVTGVEIRGVFLRNKLIIFAKGGRYVYYVEPNTAYLWRRDILHFRNLQHLYPMENNVVDNDYPFNYTVITDGD